MATPLRLTLFAAYYQMTCTVMQKFVLNYTFCAVALHCYGTGLQ